MKTPEELEVSSDNLLSREPDNNDYKELLELRDKYRKLLSERMKRNNSSDQLMIKVYRELISDLENELKIKQENHYP
ncbi:MAG: hypothetical protein ABW082_00460 [Sedimenticola sp.]